MFKSKEKKFWDWFVKNQQSIEHFVDNMEDYSIYNELTKKLKDYHSELYPEVTKEGDTYELIITPDGMKVGMEPTKKIVEKAPFLKNWELFRFRQAKDDFGIEIEDVSLELDSIKVLRFFREEEVDIGVCIEDYDPENKSFHVAGFLMLDHILGEFNVLTRVGAVEFYDWNAIKPEHETVSLLVLRKEIEEKLY